MDFHDSALSLARRREFLRALLASTLAPLTARGQGERIYRIGFVCSGCPPEDLERLKANHSLVKPLATLGYVVGKNLRFEARAIPEGDEAKSKAASEELARSQVDVLVALGGYLRCAPLAAATRKIPIVCRVEDPVGAGLAESLRRPGRNVTGIVMGGLEESASATAGLLKTMLPRLNRLVSIVPGDGRSNEQWDTPSRSMTRVFKTFGIEREWMRVGTLADIEKIFKGLGDPASVVVSVVVPEGVDDKAVRALATRHRVATLGLGRPEEVRNGALMFYGVVHSDPGGRMAAVIDRILRGANPAEIPFELPDRAFFVVNRTTAKAIGAKLPPEILMRATEVVE